MICKSLMCIGNTAANAGQSPMQRDRKETTDEEKMDARHRK